MSRTLRAIDGLDSDTFGAWFSSSAVEQQVSGTLIHLDIDDSILLSSVTKTNLSINDFILHPGGSL